MFVHKVNKNNLTKTIYYTDDKCKNLFGNTVLTKNNKYIYHKAGNS